MGEPSPRTALPMIDNSVSSSLTVGLINFASNDSPKKNPPRTPPMTIRVVAALWLSGFRNAGTPFEMASIPVSATAPDEKARRKSRTVTPVSRDPLFVSWSSDSVFGGRTAR